MQKLSNPAIICSTLYASSTLNKYFPMIRQSRLREGLHTLGVFDQVQLFPSVFFGVFCEATQPLKAEMLGQLFTINFSEQEEKLNKETPVVTFWRHLLLECEVGRSSISLQDILHFATGADKLPAAGLSPPPSISFLHHPASSQVSCTT
ncbi:hypothetical protein ATANTOWER_013593 [Ataeniobius toweri]|uniref:Uncharacterized protein n=1 Tax=Ataeniobius toweri TaxID=208326 RepID=A0ABU7CIS8_9TELE|nr:hypothetical protein [Ataeniobius toweri]